MLPVYINGKFYSGGLNGVHRVSDRLVRELDTRLDEPGMPPITLLLPTRHSGNWRPECRNIVVRELDEAPTQGWEQRRLSALAADGVLVNLANLSPLLHRRKITMIHDVQFMFPDNSYPLRQRLGYKFLTPYMARSSATVLTVSEYSRRMLDVMGIAGSDGTQVLYNGVDHILETPADDTVLADHALKSRGYALMFGSAKAYKNNAVVFAAYARNAPHDVPLVIVGAPREKFAGTGIEPPAGTIFVGRCDDAQLRALYTHARCVLCPSRTEGFGLPPLEAMLCGTPAVVAPAGALPEVCRDAALYADVDDPDSWSRAIASLDPEGPLFASKVADGLARASRFTWSAAGKQLLDAILALSAPPLHRAA